MGVFTGTATVGLVGSYSTTSPLTSPNELINLAMTTAFANGTGSGQANRFVLGTGTLVGSSGTTYNLCSGTTLVDIYGSSTVFTKVKGLIVHNKSIVATEILRASGLFVSISVAPASNDIIIGPSGILTLISPIDGYAAATGVSDTFRVANLVVGTTVSYDLVIWGTA